MTSIEILDEMIKKHANLSNQSEQEGFGFENQIHGAISFTLNEAKERIEKECGWIRVSERPPKKDGTFFLCVHDKSPEYIISAYWGTYHPNAKGENCWRNSRREKIIFTHWMPLPSNP